MTFQLDSELIGFKAEFGTSFYAIQSVHARLQGLPKRMNRFQQWILFQIIIQILVGDDAIL